MYHSMCVVTGNIGFRRINTWWSSFQETKLWDKYLKIQKGLLTDALILQREKPFREKLVILSQCPMPCLNYASRARYLSFLFSRTLLYVLSSVAVIVFLGHMSMIGVTLNTRCFFIYPEKSNTWLDNIEGKGHSESMRH